ncbi:MAG: hypothetical protein ACR2QT_05530 [Woeseiaceae bacterium]
MSTSTKRPLLALTIFAFGVSGCCTSPSAPQEVDRALIAWLDCGDCMDEEFDTLTDYCEKYVASRLALIVTHGPPPEVLQAYEIELRATYKRRVAYAAATPGANPPAVSENEYVAIYTNSMINRHKIRAYEALDEVSKKEYVDWLNEIPKLP